MKTVSAEVETTVTWECPACKKVSNQNLEHLSGEQSECDYCDEPVMLDLHGDS